MHNGVYGRPVPTHLEHFERQKFAPAGDERFHALVWGQVFKRDLYYLAYRPEGWSAPVRIGVYGNPNRFGVGENSIQLTSDGRPQALAIWQKREGVLAGRWIELDEIPR